MASVAVIFSVDFAGPQILAVITSSMYTKFNVCAGDVSLVIKTTLVCADLLGTGLDM
jgi:hypothetical protein